MCWCGYLCASEGSECAGEGSECAGVSADEVCECGYVSVLVWVSVC